MIDTKDAPLFTATEERIDGYEFIVTSCDAVVSEAMERKRVFYVRSPVQCDLESTTPAAQVTP